MPATNVTVQTVGLSPVTPTANAADGTNGNSFAPLTDTTLIRVINGSGSSTTLTVDDPTSVGPTGATQFNPDAALACPAGAARVCALPSGRFVDPATGKVILTWSVATSVTFELYAI